MLRFGLLTSHFCTRAARHSGGGNRNHLYILTAGMLDTRELSFTSIFPSRFKTAARKGCGRTGGIKLAFIAVHCKRCTCKFTENAAHIVMTRVSASFYGPFLQLRTPFATPCNDHFPRKRNVTEKIVVSNNNCFVVLLYFLRCSV